MLLKKIKTVLVLGVLLSATVFTSCDNDDSPDQDDIVDVAENRSDLAVFTTAIHAAGLAETLKGNGDFTVFAPNNEAFASLLEGNDDWKTINDIPENVLQYVLLFHVINAKVMSSDLTFSYPKTMSTGPNEEFLSLQVEVEGGVKFNGNTAPVEVDVEASNGVIHVVDRVMLPPNVVGLALNNSNFSTLVAALTDERHETDFVAALSSKGPFTVFAPDNDAFAALLATNNDWNSLADVPIEIIDAVLKYHVVAKANVQSDELANGQEVKMFDGNTVKVKLDGASVQLETGSGQNVNIVATDIQGNNGVIHAVNQVLLPKL